MSAQFPNPSQCGPRIGWSSYLLVAAGSFAVVLAVVAPLWAFHHLKIDLPPMVGDDVAVTLRNQPVEIVVLRNDADPVGLVDPRTVTIEIPPLYGRAVPNPETGTVTYSPHAEFVGQDVFTYTVRNPDAARSSPATVTITVTP